MRLWSLHPRYLDTRGLVALWREGLLAQAVLRGSTRGYRQHPQLQRFAACAQPVASLTAYLHEVHREALARGHAFDVRRIDVCAGAPTPGMVVTRGQLAFEWQHLMDKLCVRSPAMHERWRGTAQPQAHPLFEVQDGGVEPWERGSLRE